MSKKAVTHRKVRRKKGKAGRPLKLDDDLIGTICEFIRDGCYVETAAAAAGIAKDTFYDWLKKGAKADNKSIYKRFSDAISVAMAEAEMKDVRCISLAVAKGNWNAAAWRLERRNPKRWAAAKRGPDDEEDDDENKGGFTLNYNLDD